MGRSSTVTGSCASCETAIFDDHPYAWCDRCGAPLPETLRAALPKLQERPRPRQEPGVPLTVRGRAISCPICQHERFYTSKKVVAGRMASLLSWQFASASADTYICVACGHMLWFMTPQ